MSYTVIRPANPMPRRAPVVFFMMGNFAALPSHISYLYYGALYQHFARKGYIVIHPSNEYLSADNRPAGLSINDVDDIYGEIARAALSRQFFDRVAPAIDRKGIQFAIGGHSFGGLLALLVADRAKELGLPQPRAILMHDPSPVGITSGEPQENPMAPENLEIPEKLLGIAADTKVLAITSAESHYSMYGVDPLSLAIKHVHMQAETRTHLSTIANENYSHLYISRDDHGHPVVESAHLSNGGTPWRFINQFVERVMLGSAFSGILRVDATDWYGYWKSLYRLAQLRDIREALRAKIRLRK